MTLEEYRKSEPLKSCYLTKDDLQQLVRLITNQVPPIDVRISAQISTSRKIESQSLDVFLAHPDLPPILSELDISTFDRVQSITIRIGGPLSMYAVRGRDEVWVLGNFQRLQEFFDRFLVLHLVSVASPKTIGL